MGRTTALVDDSQCIDVGGMCLLQTILCVLTPALDRRQSAYMAPKSTVANAVRSVVDAGMFSQVSLICVDLLLFSRCFTTACLF
jgi:hypothetical protein